MRASTLSIIGRTLPAAVLLFLLTRPAHAQTQAPGGDRTAASGTITWSNGFGTANGMNAAIDALAAGASGTYAGGSFTTASGTFAVRIARWNGRQWVPLGSGADDRILAVAVRGDTVYAGGLFHTIGGVSASHVARWDGSAWAALGTGIETGTAVSALALDTAGRLYAGGTFSRIGGIDAANVAMWDPTLVQPSWVRLGSHTFGPDGPVSALIVTPSNTLFAGGAFQNADGSTAVNIARWDAVNGWSAAGTPTLLGSGAVNALALSGGTLITGGSFSGMPSPGNGIAMFDIATSQWSTACSGLNGAVRALAADDSGRVYAGGDFTTAGASQALNIARWDGSAWTPCGDGLASPVSSLAVCNDTVIAAGSFTSVGSSGATANRVARWDRRLTAWRPFWDGIDGDVYAVAASGADIYIGGAFTAIGTLQAAHIAKWSGTGGAWEALGAGLLGNVFTITLHNGSVYAGGSFTQSGDLVTVNNVARYDGTWTALTSGGITGTNGAVRALVHDGTRLYAGGAFTTAGNVNPANRIAAYGATGGWSALGTGVGGVSAVVHALCTTDSGLVAGGSFTTAGGSTVNRIARWDGSAWSRLGSGTAGLNQTVRTLACSGGLLYAGGDFTTAGGLPANRIARWDGSAWSALGSGIAGTVNTIALSGGNVYAGGAFSTAGGVACSNVAVYDGVEWTPVSGGTSDEVRALVVQPGTSKRQAEAAGTSGRMLVGGLFTATDGAALGAPYLASFTSSGSGGDPFPVELAAFSARVAGAHVRLAWSTLTETNSHGFHVERMNVTDPDQQNGAGGAAWKSVGFVPGAHSSSSPRTYAFTDSLADVSAGWRLLAYRLRQVDRDGRAHRTQHVTVSRTVAAGAGLGPVHPHPARGHASAVFRTDVSTTARIALHSVDGRLVHPIETSREFPGGDHIVHVPRMALPAGLYFVVVHTPNHRYVRPVCFTD